MRFQAHRPIAINDPPIVSCTCGWRGTSLYTPTESQAGFSEWLELHWNVVLPSGHLHALIALSILNDLDRAWMKLEHIHWRADNVHPVTLAWGWWCTVNRSAHGILTMFNSGLAAESMPLLRSMFEHTLFLYALSKDGERAFGAAVRRHWGHLQKVANDAAGGPFDTMITGTGSMMEEEHLLPPSDDAAWTQQVVRICEKLGKKTSLYVVYRILCNRVHPSVTTAEEFLHFTQDEDEPPQFRKWPDLKVETDILFWAACLVIWAGQAFEEFVAMFPMKAEIEQAASKLTIPRLEDFSGQGDFGAIACTPEEIEELINESLGPDLQRGEASE